MKKLFLSVFVAFFATFSVFSVPAIPYPIEVTQPDGTTLTIRLHGDEFLNYATTEDGYMITKNQYDFYVYATVSQTGEMETTTRIARNSNSRSAADASFLQTLDVQSDFERYYEFAQANPSPMKEAMKQATQTPQLRTPKTGTPKFVVLLVQFSDRTFANSSTAVTRYSNLLNQAGYNTNGSTGSVKDYYVANSYGKFNPDFVVYGPVTLPKTAQYYCDNDGAKVPEMVAAACSIANSNVNFAEYDNDNDGYVDNVLCFVAGWDRAQGAADATNVWSHRYVVSSSSAGSYGVTFDSKKISDYFVTAELKGTSGSTMTNIGVFVHEFGHIIDLPDYYHTSSSSKNTLNYWSPMDQGSYCNDMRTPPMFSSYDRFFLGWLTPEQYTSGLKTVYPLSQSGTAAQPGQAYLVAASTHNMSGSSPNPAQFFMIEYRDRTGWDAYLGTGTTSGTSGMLIWHIDYLASAWTNNSVNNYTGTSQTSSSHMRVYLQPTNGASTTTPGGAFTSGSFTPTLWSGVTTGLPQITDITKYSTYMTFGAVAGCTNGQQYPTGSAYTPTCTGSAEAISTTCNAGQYSLVNVTSGKSYTFASSVNTYSITLATDVTTPVVLTTGTGSVTWTATSTTAIRFYTHTNSSCGTATTNHTRSVTCTPDNCISGTQYPSGSAYTPNCTGSTEAISTTCNAGQYSLVNVTSGKTYTFSSSTSSYYITLATNATSPVILTTGTGSITWTATSTTAIRFYTHTNSSCGTATTNHTRSVTCTPDNCISGTQYPSSTFTPNCTGSAENISTSCNAGQYSLVSVTSGKSYTFASSVNTYYITLATNTATPVLITTGTGSVTWTATSSTTIRFYTHTNSSCGTATTNHTRSVTCNPDNCISGTQYPSGSAYTPNCTGSAEAISTTCNAGQYSLVSVTSGKNYTFSSSINTYYITLATNAATPVLITTGTGSVTWTATSTTTIRFYTHTNSNCGTATTNHSRSVTCNPVNCTTGNAYPENTTFTPSCTGSAEAIKTDCYTGEYSRVNVTSGKTYTFSSSVNTYFITLATNATTPVVITTGTGSVTWTATSTSTIRFYTYLNSNCGSAQTKHTRSVTCNPDNCMSGSQYPASSTFTPSCTGSAEAISTTCNAGQYSLVNVTSGKSYTFASSINTYYITLATNATTPVLITTGTGSVTWTATSTSTIRFYTHTNSNCGTATTNHTKSVTCEPSVCTNTSYASPYPEATFTPSCTGSAETIKTDCYTGEYSLVNVTSGKTYTFSSSVTTYFITLATDATTPVVLTTGTGSVTWEANVTAAIRFYTYMNSSCGASQTKHSRRVKCDIDACTTPVTVFPWTETFESNSPTIDCWDVDIISGTANWYLGTSVSNVPTGSTYVYYYINSSATNVAKLTSPFFQFNTSNTYKLSFEMVNRSWSGSINELKIYYRTSSGGAWTLIPGQTYTTANTNWTTKSDITLPNPSATYQLAFEGINNRGYPLAIDNVKIVETVSCQNPVVTLSSKTATTATISWTGTATNYKIEWGAAGFTPNTGTQIGSATVNALSYTIPNLEINESYDAYVRAECNSTNISSWIKVNFTTSCQPYNNTVNTPICSGSSYTFPDGSTMTNITSPTSQTSHLTTMAGCDSVVVTNITVKPKYNKIVEAAVCSGGSYIFPNGDTKTNITSPTSQTSVLTTTGGCDSVIITNISIAPKYNKIVEAAVCAGSNYIFPDGTIKTNITSPTSQTSNLKTVVGCDSIVITNISISSTLYSNFSKTICKGDNYIFFGKTLTESGTYTDIVTTSGGCDSIITLTLSVISADVSITVSHNILTVNQVNAVYQWYKGCVNGNSPMVPIPEATSQSYAPAEDGYYTVEVTYNNCVFVSECIYSSETGVGIVKDNAIVLYPNPAKGIVNIDILGIGKARAVITDLSGRTVETFNIGAGDTSLQINVSNYADGTYLVRIISDNKNFVERLVVKN